MTSQLRKFGLIVVLWGLFPCLTAACSALGATPTPESATPVVQPKLLATLYVSPTPNDQEREATRFAVRAESPTPAPSNTPLPTAYVGVFVGDAGGVDSSVPVDSTQFDGTVAPVFPTLGATGCPYPVDAIFGTSWTSNDSALEDLGCAGEPSHTYVGTQQIFEHGVMYWIPSGEIWILSPSGGIDGQFWYAEQSPPDQGWTVPAPSGLLMPERGFGAVWKAVDGVRQTLGFARLEEQSVSLAIQRFENGALLRDETAGQTFIVVGVDAGSAFGPY